MFRTKINELIKWKSKPKRKPLIINGARQVGKSWLVKHFGDEYFTGNTITINFDLQRDLHSIFNKNLDVKRIISEVELALDINIVPGADLLFFDEVQACPNALAALRYFYEDFPKLHLIAAGSLLDFEFRYTPFPVGRVDVLDLYPMTFYEFLLARNKVKLSTILRSPIKDFNNDYLTYFEPELHLYMIVGGMPEVVHHFITYHDLIEVKNIQKTLLYTYEQDFRKYKPLVNSDCLNDILDNTFKGLGGQTIYTKLSQSFTSPTIKKGVEVLTAARLIHKISNASPAGLPLILAGKQFKLYFLDIGLLTCRSGIDVGNLYLKGTLTIEFNGALSEQFVSQQLIAKYGNQLRYWARTEQGASSQVDFIYVEDGKIIPVEVKAGKSGSLKSMHYLLDKNPNIEKAMVYSLAPKGEVDKIKFVPIVFAGM